MNEALSISDQVREMAEAAGVDADRVFIEMAERIGWSTKNEAYSYLTDKCESKVILDAQLNVLDFFSNHSWTDTGEFTIWLAELCGFDEIGAIDDLLDTFDSDELDG